VCFVIVLYRHISCSQASVDGSGDIVSWVSGPGRTVVTHAEYGTLFNLRRSFNIPDIDLSMSKPGVVTAPAPVSMGPTSYVGSWINVFTSKNTSGAEIDLLRKCARGVFGHAILILVFLVGGPNRPVITPQAPKSTSLDRGASANKIADNLQQTQTSMYDQLGSAMNERGWAVRISGYYKLNLDRQMLNELEEQFNALQQGASSMVSQVRRWHACFSSKK
jgi:hypothetical protein